MGAIFATKELGISALGFSYLPGKSHLAFFISFSFSPSRLNALAMKASPDWIYPLPS